MVNFELQNTHHLIILNIDGKSPIRVSAGSINFHNANDLLCCSLAACLGNNLKRICIWESIDPRIFQTITVDLHNDILEVRIKCPEAFEIEKRNFIIRELSHCSVAKLLNNKINIEFINNDLPIEELTKDKTQRCCGG